MADAYSFLPGTANTLNASFGNGAAAAGSGMSHGHHNHNHQQQQYTNHNQQQQLHHDPMHGGVTAASDTTLLDFNIQSTRKTVEILQAQVQLLTMRVDALERQNTLLAAIVQQQQQQQRQQQSGTDNAAPTATATATTTAAAAAAAAAGTSPYLSPCPPASSTSSVAADSPSSASRQPTDEEPHRFAINNSNAHVSHATTSVLAGLPTSPSQPMAPGSAGSDLFAASALVMRQQQQQQLAAAMLQHQREEAIMQMLQGQGSPTSMTPTAPYPSSSSAAAHHHHHHHSFPTGVGVVPPPPPPPQMQMQIQMQPSSGMATGITSPVAPGPTMHGGSGGSGTVANLAYLYSPTGASAPVGIPGSSNSQHLGVPQHQPRNSPGNNINTLFGGGGGNSPSLGSAGVPPHHQHITNPYMGFPAVSSGSPTHNSHSSGMQQQQQQTGNLSTTVTLDPSKHNSNESLERACQQPWLKELILKNCKNINSFAPVAKLRNLWKLNLQGCSLYVDDSVVKLLATYNKRLSRLNLCGCEKIADATALLQLNFLFDLNLSGCTVGNASIEAVATGCQQLSRLAINSCPLVTDISALRKLKELKLLYCRYSANIAPASIVQVLHGIGGGLLTLNIDGVKFSRLSSNLAGPGPVTGTTLPMPLALKNLNMKDNAELVSLDWLTFSGAERYLPSLEMLDVEGCTSLTVLGPLHIFPSLKSLRLSKTSITQAAFEAAVGRCPALTSLFIDGCAGVKSIECLARCPALQKVVMDAALNSSPVAANGLAALQQRNGGRVEVVVAASNSSGSNNAGGGGGQHYGVGNSLSATGSPTSNFVPSVPTR